MRVTRTTMLTATTALIAVVAAACGGSGSDPGASGAGDRLTDTPDVEASEGGWIGADGELVWTGGGARGSDGGGGAYDAEEATLDLATTRDDRGVVGAPEPLPVEPDEPPIEPIVDPVAEPPVVNTYLTAGSVDDNDAWEDYLLYRQDFLTTGIVVHDVDVSGRQMVRVTDSSGLPVLGASVEIVTAEGTVVARRTTLADGRIMFFAPRAADPQSPAPALTARVTKGEVGTEVALSSEALVHDLVLDGATSLEPVPLDVLLLIDATGSMADEIEQLKANMVSVAEQIDALDPRPDVRFAMTVYRDHGDLFVTRTFDFTSDVAIFTDALREVVADGGGDTPEALDEALQAALAEPSWRDGEAVRLVFLVADAPPHLGDGLDSTVADYATEALLAAERGVKLHPIASSGLDAQGEYVLRQLAQLTFGRFNFLTYGADGASPGESTPHHVDDYSVLSLDELVVQLVADELAARTAPVTG